MATFRGASADAVATLTEQLSSLSGDDAARTGEDLFAVAGAIRAEGSLRRFVTDMSVADEAKSGLVDQVLGDKVGSTALGVVKDAVGRRWTVARDLADALEHLGVVAHVRSAGNDSGRLGNELFEVIQTVKDNPGLRDALSDPVRSVADKAGLVDALLSGKALPATVALTKQALAGSYRTVVAALAEYEKVAAEVHGEGVATVRVARPLSDAELGRLTDALARQYDRPVHVNMLVDPEVLGGIRVEIGDDVIDGTVSSRLDEARRRIAG